MIDINTALQNILKAIYGKDVRESIHDAIYQINQNANEAVELAQIKFGTDVKNPTSPIGSYVEGTIYFNVETGVIWKLRGGSWSMLGTMKTIESIDKTATSGLVDTYTILYNDKSTSTFDVTNGEKGISVTNITKTSTVGNVDHYDINLSDGSTTPNGFDVTNGVSVSNITLASTVGNTKNYEVNLSDGTKTPNGFSVTDGASNYVHIRYSANFDGQGMVTVPTEQTVYIGIVVTTQSNAPTDPAVYSWVRFIGKSGTGTGDMLKADYSTLYENVVDKAAALFDGTKEISATQLMAKSDYATKGVAGTVDKATQLVDVTNSKVADTVVLAKLSESGGKLQFNGKTIDVDIDNNTIVKNASEQLTLGSSVTTKLSKLDTDTVPSENGMALAWDGQKYTPQTVKGGHELITVEDGVDGVLNNTEEEKVVDALVVKEYANTYTERVLMTLKAGENTVGTWQDEEPEDWEIDEDHFVFAPNFYEADDEELTFSFIFDTSNNEPIFRKGFEWVSQTNVMKEGKPCGALCIRCANAPTVDTIIGVDITRVRFDNVIVIPENP